MISAWGLAVSLGVSTAMTVTSVAAWLGYSWARFSLMGLTVIFYGLIAYNLYSLGTSGTVPEHRMSFVWTRIARSLIMMAAVVLYLLLSRNATEFFSSYRRKIS